MQCARHGHSFLFYVPNLLLPNIQFLELKEIMVIIAIIINIIIETCSVRSGAGFIKDKKSDSLLKSIFKNK